MTLNDLATLLNGTLLAGDPAMIVDAPDIGYAADARALAKVSAPVVLLAEGLDAGDRAAIRVANPRAAFHAALAAFDWRRRPAAGVHPTAVVDSAATIDPSAAVGPYAVIEAEAVIGPGCVVGAHVTIGHESALGECTVVYPRVTIYPRCRIGARCIVHAGAVLGADGFGYDRTATGWMKIPQVGWVVIGDDVEIGANSTIDRATAGETVIGPGTKVDNLVMVAHNAQVGARTLLIAQVGVAGSSTIGDDVILAGQVGVADHVTVGHRSMVGAQAGVIGSIPDNSIVGGSPARPHMENQRAQAALLKLPELRTTVRDLAKRVAELEAKLGEG